MSVKSIAPVLFLVAGKSCRNMAAVIAVLLFLGSSRADVYLANLNPTNGNVTTPATNIIFNASQSDFIKVTGLKLFGATGQTISAKFSWDFTTPTTLISSTESSSGEYLFDLSNLNYTNFYADEHPLVLREMIASGTGVQTTATDSATYVAPGFSYTRTDGDELRFQLVSVPEPGTMLLASLAAACGGGGVWWRKRKTAKNQAEPEPQAEV